MLIAPGIGLRLLGNLGRTYHDSFFWEVGSTTYLLEVASWGAYHHWQTVPPGWDNPHLAHATPADLGGFRPTGTLVVDVSQLSTVQKVGEAMHRSLKYVGEEVRPILLSLINPETIGYAIALEAAYAVSMFFGVGELLTTVLVVAGVYFVGSQVIEIVDSLVGFVKGATTARSVADLEAAARLFAHGLTLSVDLVVSLLSRKLRAKTGGGKRPSGTSRSTSSSGSGGKPTILGPSVPPGKNRPRRQRKNSTKTRTERAKTNIDNLDGRRGGHSKAKHGTQVTPPAA